MDVVVDQNPQPTPTQQTEEVEEQDGEESERGRPSTPKWWRPPVPPETYKWEEVRRQRQKGGYPWTHLDKDEEIDVEDYLDENLYEPVNPPPLYGNESYLSKDLHVPQAEERTIEIPPEIEILTSEGLDGLDKPDPHDGGFDGDREWQNLTSEDEQGTANRSSFTAGLRKDPGEPRPTTPKSVGFAAETITHECPEEPDQEVPEDMQTDAEPAGSSKHGGHGRRKTPFDILKSKAADAADHVKQKIKGAIPVRPKMKGGRKRGKAKHTGEAEEGEQEVPEDAEMKEAGEGVEGGEATEKAEEAMDVSESKAVETGEGAPEESEEKSDDKESKDDEKKRQKAEEKEEKERKKAEEKLAKQQAAEEAKKAKLEEKLAKAKEAEEARQAKAEEERKKQEEKKEEEARKAAEKAAKEEEARKAAEAKKEEDARKAAEKAAKEEEARKVAAAKKAEEDARKAAEKAAKEEEARKAAEIKKAEDEAKRIAKEEAKKAAEAKKAEEEAKKAAEKAAKEEAKRAAEAAKEEERRAAEAAKEEERRAAGIVEEVKVEEETKEQTMDTTEPPPEGEQQAEGDGGEAGDEEADPAVPQTPSGTTKRRYIKQRKNPIQLPQIPNPITMLRNQVEDYRNKLKRSRTPPRGRGQRKQRRSRSADASRSPPRDVGDEEEETGEAAPVEDTEMEPQQEEKAPATETKASAKSETKPAEAEPVKEAVQQSSAPAEVEEEIQPAEEPPATTGKGTTKRKQPAAKEKLDKLGGHLKSIGAKTIGVASQATGAIGQTMKVVGKDLQKLGSKGIEKCQSAVVEIKAKQNAAKNKEMQGEEVEEEVVEEIPPPEIAPPKRTFRFRRRNESQDEGDEEDQEHFYENAQEINQERQQRDDDLQRNRLLGRADRDWESPMDRAQSRDVSEEPYISSRDSPPGSSITSSTIANARRPGVLEEIDSDEFFLRERGISEGEDEEEVNRFLVEELRQAFRPTMSNALAGFDLEPPLVPPPRPDRPSRKPAREAPQEESAPTSYQTFPPERPKRKGPQGYVSKFMKENEGDEEDEEYMGSNEEVRGSSDDMKESIEEGDEAIQMVKDKLSEIDRELDEGATSSEPPQQPRTPLDDYEDDGRYEPISDKPVKPMRTKKKAPKRPPTPPSFYYNTIAGNEWLRELEAQVQDEPAAPIRKRRGSGKSASLPPSTGDEEVKAKVDDTPSTEQVSDTIAALTEPRADSAQEETFEGSSQVSGQNENDYIDEAGYAIVQKDNLPRTVPRKKKKRTKADDAQGPSGLRQGEEANAAFMSLPHRPFQVVPPARPSRTYSTLKPKRPPRSKSGSRNSLESKSPSSSRRGGGEGDEPRPSTAIGIMQGRPLPPPPRPSRSPAPLNDLDQSSIEQALGVRHYANFEELEPRQVEEIFTASNIPLLGPRTEVFSRPTEVDIACQTDPVPDDEFMAGFLAPESPLLDSSRIRTASSELAGQETQPRGSQATATGDVSSSFQTPRSQHDSSTQSQPTQPPQFVFPTRLHLEQLEVDFLRVNDLIAQSIRVEHLQAPQLEVNSLNATGPLCVSRIQTQSLSSEEVNCSRLTSDKVELPSVPPPSFYQLSSPDDDILKPGSEQELCLKTEEKEEKENESACPPEFLESVHNLMGYVDSTNDLKSSHVAEKILDKQLNVAVSTQTSSQPKSNKRDASVGTHSTPITSRTVVPQQQNNLNQEPSQTKQQEEPKTTQEEVAVKQEFVVESVPSEPQSIPSAVTEPEEESEEQVEETVVVGSYTLPYSYLPTQSPSLSRTGSTESSQPRSTAPVPEPTSGPSPAEIQTSVADGEVLSVKFSIPVERGSTGQSTTGKRPTPPRSGSTSTQSRLQDSANAQAESSKGDAQQPVATKEIKPTVAPARPSPPRRSSPVRVTPLLRSSPPTRSSPPARASPPARSTPPPRSTPPAVSPPPTPSTPPAPSPPPSQAVRRISEDGDDSMLSVAVRLGRAVLRFTMRTLQAMAEYIDTAASEDPAKAEQQRANMQVLLCLLLVLVVGLILATTRSGPYSSPRWEFLMPPPDL